MNELFEVYGKPGCPNCELLKKLLASTNNEYKYIDVSEDTDALAFIKREGFKSVPQVYHNGKHVGGYQETLKYVNSKGK